MKLLIVDDNAAVRRLIRSIVLPLAGDICECTDGADALATYLAQRPDVVLMDIRMNEVDAIQATKQITAADRKAPILIGTGYNDTEWRQAPMHARPSGHPPKRNRLELI